MSATTPFPALYDVAVIYGRNDMLPNSTSAAATDLADGLASSLSSMMPILTVAMMLFAVIITVMGVARIIREGADSGGWSYIIGGILIGGASVLAPWLIGSFNDTAPKPKTSPHPTGGTTPQPTTTTSPTRAPEPVQQPADLTWLWIMLGVIAATILTVLLIWLIIHLSTRARRSLRAAREAADALRALQESRTATWRSFHDRLDELLRKIFFAETDWDTLFFMPALSDSSDPHTYEMLRAMRTATTLRDTAGEMPSNLSDDIDLTKLPFPRAVDAFALAWDAAERNARKIGQKNIPVKERRLIKQIRTFLDMAENSAASETERNLAYKRALALIADLESITIPTRAMEQLEERKLLALTTSEA